MANSPLIRYNETIHSRIVIKDDREVLVSSADFNKNSLIDQFNAGISTKDKETVRKAIEYFDNIWGKSYSEKAKKGK